LPNFRPWWIDVPRLITALAAGGITVLGFAPVGLYPLAILAPAVLIWLWLDASPRSAFWLGLWFGIGLFGAGVSWVFVSLHVYGRMPVPLAVLTVAIFVLLLSLYPALVGAAQASWFRGRTSRALLLIPGCWVIAEWVRSWLLSGFPWLSLGYSQVGTWLQGYAPLIGVYGVSLLVVLQAGLTVTALSGRGRGRALSLLAICGLWLAGGVLMRIDWVAPSGPTLDVALVQGNVPLADKWSATQRGPILLNYLAGSRGARDADLVVWPESALPYYLDELPEWLWTELEEHPAHFAFGVLERDRSGRTFNSVVAVAGGRSLYRKEHLVPFGEFLPLQGLLAWLLDYLHIPMSDFTAWADPQQPLRAAGTTIGVSVCYEDAFPAQVRQLLPAAQLLLNVSEDAWFGDSLAPHQRLQMARMRALESGRPMLRAANTGVSAVIDHRGEVTVSSPQFERVVLSGEVQPMSGSTPYVSFGELTMLVMALLMVLAATLLERRFGDASGPALRPERPPPDPKARRSPPRR
jgi:apolipoprotein N-acyltransferase